MFKADPTAVLALARERDMTVACAESVTGGALCSALVGVAGASDVVVGGVVAYTESVKASVLGLDPQALREHGVVSERTAVDMAGGVKDLLQASIGVATTGVAGPDSHGGEAAGTVWVAVCTESIVLSHRYALAGDREAVRARAVDAALALLMEALGGTVLRRLGSGEHN